MHVHTHARIHKHAFKHTYARTHEYIYIYACVRACVRVRGMCSHYVCTQIRTRLIMFIFRGKYGKWSQDEMQKALTALRNGEMGLNATSRAFQIPKATLKRHLDEKNAYAKNDVKHFGHPKVLTDDLDTLLVKHVLKLEAMFSGVNRIDLRKMAYQLAAQNDLHTVQKPMKLVSKKGKRQVGSITSAERGTTQQSFAVAVRLGDTCHRW